MKAKKNPKKDLSRNSGMYFIAGLAMVLALTYVAFEWKTFYGYNPDCTIGHVIEEDISDKPFVFITPPPPPPPPVAPEVIKVVEDVALVDESDFMPTESNDNTEVIEIHSLDFDEGPEEDLLIPFLLIEDAPIFPGCENETDKHACFNTMMKKHIKKNFRYPEIERELGIQGRVSIMFEIQKDGNIGNVQMRGPNKNLEKEAARIIDKLPRMTPGKQRGKNVRVPFSIPITFKLQ